MFLTRNRIYFSKLIFPNPKIISAIPLPRFKSGSSELAFAYSRLSILISFKMATDLENFYTKNLYFRSKFIQYHITITVAILLNVLRGLGNFLWYGTDRPSI